MNWRDFFPLREVQDERVSTPSPVAAADVGRLEPGSETWLYIAAHADAEIKRLREKNDSSTLDETQTAVIRGQIKAWKALLALGKPKADSRRLSDVDDD